MERRKLTKEDIDNVRNIDGFPIAKDEDIIALSDAPYYTACPNPFIGDFIKENGKPYDEAMDDYHCEPFSSDVSEGKNDPIYNSHNYHTKVPPKAIMRYILHYTKPGDIILDGFCGSGMTGVAVKKCEHPEADFKVLIEKEMPSVQWGKRNSILSDLSPAATFISYGHNSTVNPLWYANYAKKVLEESEAEFNWVYKTTHVITDKTSKLTHSISNKEALINYTVWSDVFICPTCGEEIVFTEAQKTSGNLRDAFICAKCSSKLKKSECKRAKEYIYDEYLQKTTEISKQIPVLINYTYCGKRFEKRPDDADLKLIEKISKMTLPYKVPIIKLPEGCNTEQPRKSHGVDYMHQFYTKRNLYVISVIYNHLKKYRTPDKQILLFTFEQILMGMSKISRYVPTHYSQVNQYLSGTLYIASQVVEVTPRYILENKIKHLRKVYENSAKDEKNVIISTSSTTELPIPDSSVDYIFTDPPFGANLNYSELSFMWEAWYGVLTNNKEEAIMNSVQGKGLVEYQNLMTDCFCEYYRVLKPNRWMTVEFHNSKNSVWNAIQEALLKAGFIIADVRTLDKKQGSFKQVTTSTAVKQDLVISAYRPKESFKKKFLKEAGNEDTAWDFVKQHLENIPVVVIKNHNIELISERQAFLLFDRMVAYHIVNGIPVPIDATDFYKGLDERFLKRDGMYFLSNQVNEYDTARIINDVEPIQFSLLISNEKNAIAWLYQQLDTPQTYAEIAPKFMKMIQGVTVDKYETIPELSVLLAENFLQDDEEKWYVPDVSKEADVAKLREKNLLKEFEGYLATKGKLRLFRSEAVRVGFAKLWKDKNYKLIVETAERLPEQTVQEDDKLLMYYDISLGRL